MRLLVALLLWSGIIVAQIPDTSPRILTNNAPIPGHPSLKDYTYGAKGDETGLTCTVTNGSTAANCTGASFVNLPEVSGGDIGKTFFCYGTSNWTTTILAVTSTTSVTTAPSPVAPQAYTSAHCGYVTDDTAAIQAWSAAVYAARRANPTPSGIPLGDGTTLGTMTGFGPPGTYLITSAQALMPSTQTGTPIYGWALDGACDRCTFFDYRPTSPGPLYYNNNTWSHITLSNHSYTGNDPGSDWFDSYSTGQASDYVINRVWIAGNWLNGINLTGTNDNSEMYWNGGGTFATFAGAFLNIGSSGSDQFLNYHLTNFKWNGQGNFLSAQFGGHFTMDNSAMSDQNGSGNSAAPFVLFNLLGNSHAFGTTYLDVKDVRVELKTNSVVLLKSIWGSYGQVTFQDVDTSSQANAFSPPICEEQLNFSGSDGGALYNFLHDHLMGQMCITWANTDVGYYRGVQIEDTEFVNYDDPWQAIVMTLPSGANYSGIPVVEAHNIRGIDRSISLFYPHWAATTTYASGALVFSNNYVYAAAGACTSGSTAPYGRTTSISDGGCTWATQDLYNGVDYVRNGIARPFTNPTPGTTTAFQATLGDRTNFNYLPASFESGAIPGFARIILPPYATVTEVDLNMPVASSVSLPSGGACNQATEGDFVVRNDNYTPTTLVSLIPVNPLDGGVNYVGPLTTWYNTGSDIGSRTIILQANTNVSQNCPGSFVVKYF